MICTECAKQGLKSTVQIRSITKTLAVPYQYYDENGKHHQHDPNEIVTNYYCSNGHSWIKKTNPICWCGWERERIMLETQHPIKGEAYWILTPTGWTLGEYQEVEMPHDEPDRYFLTFGADEEAVYLRHVKKMIHVPQPGRD